MLTAAAAERNCNKQPPNPCKKKKKGGSHSCFADSSHAWMQHVSRPSPLQKKSVACNRKCCVYCAHLSAGCRIPQRFWHWCTEHPVGWCKNLEGSTLIKFHTSLTHNTRRTHWFNLQWNVEFIKRQWSSGGLKEAFCPDTDSPPPPLLHKPC